MGLYDAKPCGCGSGQTRQPNHDARGIFLCFTCSTCHSQKMSRYRPEVLTNPSYRADEPIDED